MEAKSIRRRWTYDEFARLQRVVMRLLARLHPFVQEHRLGEVFPGPLDILFAEGD